MLKWALKLSSFCKQMQKNCSLFVCICCKQRYMPNMKKMVVKSCSSWSQFFSVSFSEYSSIVILTSKIQSNLYRSMKSIQLPIYSCIPDLRFWNLPISKIYGKFDISIIFFFSFFLDYIYLFVYLPISLSYIPTPSLK